MMHHPVREGNSLQRRGGPRGLLLGTIQSLLIVTLVSVLAGCAGGAGPTPNPLPQAQTGNAAVSGAAATTTVAAAKKAAASPAATNLVLPSGWQRISGQDVLAGYQRFLADRLGARADLAQTDPGIARLSELLSQHADQDVLVGQCDYDSWNADRTQKIRLSGRVFLPLVRRDYPLPIVLYPHGTELKRTAVPSNLEGVETYLGIAAASAVGAVVAMPDLPGMGNPEPNSASTAKPYHPYCHANSLAYAVADMAAAAKEKLDDFDIAWNKKLYVIGYSEGGYAAMATVREMQQHPERYGDFRVTGSACLASPCDLSGAMRSVMLGTAELPNPFFLSYIVYGYHAVYGNKPEFDPHLAHNAKLVAYQPDDKNIDDWMSGEYSGAEANDKINHRLQLGKGNATSRQLLAENWFANQIENEQSVVVKALRDNDAWRNWVPTTPMVMIHSRTDNMVPFENSVVALAAYKAANPQANVQLYPIEAQKGEIIDHVTGGGIALPAGFTWIYLQEGRG